MWGDAFKYEADEDNAFTMWWFDGGTPMALNEAYGEGYEWDRCGKMSQACERFFVQEAWSVCLHACLPIFLTTNHQSGPPSFLLCVLC